MVQRPFKEVDATAVLGFWVQPLSPKTLKPLASTRFPKPLNPDSTGTKAEGNQTKPGNLERKKSHNYILRQTKPKTKQTENTTAQNVAQLQQKA